MSFCGTVVAVVPTTFPGTRGARGVHLVSHHGMRDERAGVLKTHPLQKKISVATTEIPADDAKCGTVVPQQVNLFCQKGGVETHRRGLYA